MKGWWIALLLVFLSSCHGTDTQNYDGYLPKEGDVIFQSFPSNELTEAIETVSESAFSHCGLVVRELGGYAVLEAIGPVKSTDLGEWIDRGRGSHFAVYRFHPAYEKKIGNIVKEAKKFKGRPYDVHYSFDDEEIYCSELIFKAFKKVTGEDLGIVRRLRELNWKPKESFIRRAEGGVLPLEREMITPKDLSEAAQFNCIYRRGF